MISRQTGLGPQQTGLAGICTEVLENILGCLDVDTIKNLRLTSKALSERCLVPRFKRCFEHLNIDLVPEMLNSLSCLAASPHLRAAVKNLTVMAIVYDTSESERIVSMEQRQVLKEGPDLQGDIVSTRCTGEEPSVAQADLAWLHNRIEQREACPDESIIESLAEVLGLLGSLDGIELDATTIRGPSTKVGWHKVWFQASKVYRLTMAAIARSGVAVDNLTVFRRKTPRCSIPSLDITRHMVRLHAENFCAAGSYIKDFSASISMKVETDPRKLAATREKLKGTGRAYRIACGPSAGLYKADDPEAVAEDNFPGIASLLRCMPNLKRIDLHLRKTLDGDTGAYDKIFTEIAEKVHMPMLRECCLGGLRVNEESMLKFLETHPHIEHLDLREIHLTSGSWEPIFKFLCSSLPDLKRLRLSNLWHGTLILINLHPVWAEDSIPFDFFCPDPWYYPCKGGVIVHTREFDADDLQKGLEFRPRPTGEMLSSPLRYIWSTAREEEYGPPISWI